MRQYAFFFLLFAAQLLSAQTPQRGVEISFFPNFADTTAGNIIQFELVAKNEDGVIQKDWDATGYIIELTLQGSTANLDTNKRSWNSDKLGYSFVELFDSYGNTFPKSSPNTFSIAPNHFGNGKLLVALQCTKAEKNVYVDIAPKTAMSAKQNSHLFTYRTAALTNFLVDITPQSQDPFGVYLMREFEAVVTARDRFMNSIETDLLVKWSSRFASELLPGPWQDFWKISFPTAQFFTFSNERNPASGDKLQYLRVELLTDPSIYGVSQQLAVLPHAPSGFDLTFPPDNYNINLNLPETPVVFQWETSLDPYSDVLVSRTTGLSAMDTVRYTMYFLDKGSLVRKVDVTSDDHGLRNYATLTHAGIAQIARDLYGPSTTFMDAYWTVEATDGLYYIPNTPLGDRPHTGYRLTVNLSTLDASQSFPVAEQYSLSQNFPNPFNPSTTISYSVPERTPVRIQVFDIYGALVKTLVDTQAEAGSYSVVWNAINDEGLPVAAGTYIARMQAGSYTSVRSMSLIK